VPAIYVVLMLMKSRSASSDPAGLVGLSVLVLGVTAVLAGILRRSTTEMAVTNKRVVVKTGILSRRTYEILLPKVESIHVDEGLLGRVLGYGSVVFRGIGGTPGSFRRVACPLELRRQVHHQIEAYEEGSRGRLALHRRDQ